MSERQHDVTVIDPIAVVFSIMHQILNSKVALSCRFLGFVFWVFLRRVIYFLSGCSFGFFNKLIVTSSKVDNSPAVNVIIKSRGKKS